MAVAGGGEERKEEKKSVEGGSKRVKKAHSPNRKRAPLKGLDSHTTGKRKKGRGRHKGAIGFVEQHVPTLINEWGKKCFGEG